MRRKLKLKKYLPELSKKYGITQQEAKLIIQYFFKRLVVKLFKKEEIYIPKFGKFTFTKKTK